MEKIKYYQTFVTLILAFLFLSSCKKFLDEKTDNKLVIPSTLEDARALLDNYDVFNTGFFAIGIQSDDDHYLLDSYYGSLTTEEQELHRWDINAKISDDQWSNLYRAVLNANVALETIEKVQQTGSNIVTWKRLKGAALFFRANSFSYAAHHYAEPYNELTASQKPGIPLRLNSDASETSTRGTLEATWNQIVNDLKLASELMPADAQFPPTRPSKAAVFAALARAYLLMGKYDLARQSADSSLTYYNTLMNYNTIPTATLQSTIPFTLYNPEVIFQSNYLGASSLNLTNGKVDSILYSSYSANDLRKIAFFSSNGTNTFGFKGDYSGNSSSSNFNGIAVDEVYLIRAESTARSGNKDSAMAWLNKLLINRWKTGTYVNMTAATSAEALTKILQERRKELVFRGTRWFDLRRLNTDASTSKILKRVISGQTFELQPGSSKYTYYIPDNVIALSGMQQNIR